MDSVLNSLQRLICHKTQPTNLLEVMNDRDEWQERVREICANSAT